MEKWNYKIPTSQPMWNNQKDWNQTLMVKLNMLTADIHKKTIIVVPNKFKSLIESLELYDNSTIGNKYIVEFIDSDSNIINVGDKKIEVENFEKNDTTKDEKKAKKINRARQLMKATALNEIRKIFNPRYKFEYQTPNIGFDYDDLPSAAEQRESYIRDIVEQLEIDLKTLKVN